ncbi:MULTISPECIES: hypothetical protein [unclassified Thioalkalivibrio]|uniref:hypothetical protein n=1 Tax=unclassified Thioalkalivibrio TaxID=2621013 RepID=UPI00036A7204|nr:MULTISPECIES: hypothetical protein [unclassified Thioalkalivibrio]
MTDSEIRACGEAAGLALSAGPDGAELEGRPVQCLRVAPAAAPALEQALGEAPAGCGRVMGRGTDADSGQALLVLERGQALQGAIAAEGPGSLEALGERAADWQGRHTAGALPAGEGYRRGVLQQQMRERADAVAASLDAESRAILDAELHHQGLYRFEDLPLAGSYWQSVRVYPEGAGLADLVVPPAPVPAFWQLARIALAVAVDAAGQPDAERYRALLSGFNSRRPLAAIERGAAPTMIRLAALDDWLGELEAGNDGSEWRDRLAALQAEAARLQGVWVRAAA